MKIVWSPLAVSALEQVYAYIALDSIQHAAATVTRIQLAVERLVNFPRSGRPTRIANYRQLVVSPYLITYRIEGTTILVVALRHSARLR